MKNVITIIIGKLTIIVGKLVGKGSSLPGEIALKINPNMMHEFTLPKQVIAVTGSSGKGSISTLLASIYRNNGYKVAHNSKGSNLSAGITTLLLENSTIFGKIKKDILICEVDERYTKYIFPAIKPQYVIISNITRDQPPRQGHFDLVYEEIKKALTDNMTLILNGDDPYLQKFALETKCHTIYYGINKNQYSYKKNKFKNLNLTYCPKCHKKLEYNFYHFENMGDYHCSKCDFKRPNIDYQLTKLDFKNNVMEINHQYEINSSHNMLYAAYNILASFTTASIAGINPETIKNSINQFITNKKLYDFYRQDDRDIYVLNNKNENSTTFNQSLLFLERYQKDLKTIVIGWKEISRRYHFDDLSWLYDIDFELLKNHNIDKIICVGIHRYDIATRMKYAGIEEKKIMVYDHLEQAVFDIKQKTKGDIFAILNFDYVEPFNKYMNVGDKK